MGGSSWGRCASNLTLLLFGAGGEEAERAEVRVAPIDAEAARDLARARARTCPSRW